MNDRWVKYSSIAEILSSVAIVLTLVFLAYQSKQNADALNAQLAATRVSARAAIFELALKPLDYRMQHPSIYADLHSTEDLGIEAQGQLDGYLQGIWVAREFVWLQYQDGSLDQTTFDTMMADTGLLSNPRHRTWWTENAEATFEPDFVEFINARARG